MFTLPFSTFRALAVLGCLMPQFSMAPAVWALEAADSRLPAGTATLSATESAVSGMAAAARTLLAALDDGQKAKAVFGLTDDERKNWHFVPMVRKGISLGELRPDQDHLVYGLLGSALSAEGWRKTSAIMSLEKVLFELENQSPNRDTEKYYLAVFGDPKAGQPWGWRFEGHHLSLNFTISADSRISLTPSFLGANPGEINEGPRAGLRPLGAEEDLALELARSLTPEQRNIAILPGDPPADIITGQERLAAPLSPAGIPASQLSAPQRAMVWKVIEEYVDRFRPDLTVAAKASLEKDGAELTFAWAGSTESGKGHYYRIQSPQFLFEYDNTQNNARHPHAVWRDFKGDFGSDLLKEHYQQNHQAK